MTENQRHHAVIAERLRRVSTGLRRDAACWRRFTYQNAATGKPDLVEYLRRRAVEMESRAIDLDEQADARERKAADTNATLDHLADAIIGYFDRA